MPALLSIERRGPVALVTLQRPDRRNALSIELRLEIADALDGLAGDLETACIVLTGAPPAFCSGMDTTQFGGDRSNREALYDSTVRAFRAVARCPKPLLAAVNGPALAGGFALALLCDLRIAAPAATFGFPEVLRRGIPPAYAAARAVLPAAVAAELCLTGRVVEAREALALGIAAEVVEGDEVVERTVELATRIATAPRWAVLETKRRMLLDAERTWWPLMEDEERTLREVLLERPDPAA